MPFILGKEKTENPEKWQMACVLYDTQFGRQYSFWYVSRSWAGGDGAPHLEIKAAGEETGLHYWGHLAISIWRELSPLAAAADQSYIATEIKTRALDAELEYEEWLRNKRGRIT